MCKIIFPIVLSLSTSFEPREIFAIKSALVEMDKALSRWTQPRAGDDYQYVDEDVIVAEDYPRSGDFYPAPERFIYFADDNSGLRRNVMMHEVSPEEALKTMQKYSVPVKRPLGYAFPPRLNKQANRCG